MIQTYDVMHAQITIVKDLNIYSKAIKLLDIDLDKLLAIGSSYHT
jgi:hypothetical protein